MHPNLSWPLIHNPPASHPHFCVGALDGTVRSSQEGIISHVIVLEDGGGQINVTVRPCSDFRMHIALISEDADPGDASRLQGMGRRLAKHWLGLRHRRLKTPVPSRLMLRLFWVWI